MNRPRIICHMATSLDGRIVAEGWPDNAAVRSEYEKIHTQYQADGWICGRVTMEPFAKGVRPKTEIDREYKGSTPRSDYKAAGDHASFAFAIDASGRLAWRSNDIDGDHVVAVLSGRVSDDYLAFLRARGVSYVIAGQKEVDLKLALEKIASTFPVNTVMLEGGGRINGGFLTEGLIDEVSVLVAPTADGRIGTPALFDVGETATPRRLALTAVEQRDGGIVWLRYRLDGE